MSISRFAVDLTKNKKRFLDRYVVGRWSAGQQEIFLQGVKCVRHRRPERGGYKCKY